MFLKYPVFGQLDDRPFAHCATLTVLPDGRLMCAWMGGAFETAPDVALLAATHDPESRSWSQPRVIAEFEGKSLGQPVFLPRPNGELWLFFVVIMGHDWTSAQPYWQRSLDGGYTWQDRRHLMGFPGLMFRSKVIELPGRIIVPAYDENTWRSCMMISDDEGRNWRLTPPLLSTQGNIHPTPVHLGGDHLLAYLRTGGKGGVIWRTESTDGGETWRQPEPTDLPNPNSGIDLIRLRNGHLVLAYNPDARLRTPLCVAVADSDEQWLPPRIIESEYHEISYPTLLQTPEDDIHIVYTYRRENIHYARFTESWLREGKNTYAISEG